jgi:hypothetical protein
MGSGKTLAFVGIALYVLQVFASRTDASGNALSSDTLILFSGTASVVYVIVAGIALWKMGCRRIAWLLPITSVASSTAIFLTTAPSGLNLVINAVRVAAFLTYIYAVYLLYTSNRRVLAAD